MSTGWGVYKAVVKEMFMHSASKHCNAASANFLAGFGLSIQQPVMQSVTCRCTDSTK